MKLKNLKVGFTLIELLLSIAIMALLAGISVPIYQSFQVKNDLDIAAMTIAHSLRRAQILAQAMDGDSNWGIYLQSGSITLYKGIAYASRDSSYDEITQVATTITPSGASEINFTKFSGLPTTTPNISLSSTINQTRTITINSQGIVTY